MRAEYPHDLWDWADVEAAGLYGELHPNGIRGVLRCPPGSVGNVFRRRIARALREAVLYGRHEEATR
jgi:hypothetical protein